jgi:hypothetical protein
MASTTTQAAHENGTAVEDSEESRPDGVQTGASRRAAATAIIRVRPVTR